MVMKLPALIKDVLRSELTKRLEALRSVPVHGSYCNEKFDELDEEKNYLHEDVKT